MKERYTVAALAVLLFGSALVAGQCLDEKVEESKSELDKLSDITDFGFTLFRELFPYKDTRNFFYSPYSIWNALALAYLGSGGNTETQLKKALKVPGKAATLKKLRAVEYLYKMRQMNKTDFTLNVANRAYFDKSVRLNQCMVDRLGKELRQVDMSKSDKVAHDINTWVDTTTKGRIPELVTAGDIANANMVLTNAAYFKGNWLSRFKRAKTSKELFYRSAQDFTFVDMMKQKGNFRHGKSEEIGAQILELPYEGEEISMLLLLPPFITGDKGFDAMVGRLNASNLGRALDDMWRLQVEVAVPKFSLEETVGDELLDALGSMGVTDLFDRTKANLTDFSPDGQLSVGGSIHKSFIEITEEGTEAAAATALISFRVARPVGPSKFHCNHPFLFILYDNITQNVLFMGAYKSPKNGHKKP